MISFGKSKVFVVMPLIDYLDLSGMLGILACVLFTTNFLMGMLLSATYQRLSWWSRLPVIVRQLNMTNLHNYTAYIAWCVALLHALLLPMDNGLGFHWSHLIWGLNAPKQPVFVLLGSISLMGFAFIIITTQKSIKRSLGFRFWKNIHLLSYCLAIIFIVHGLFMDPLLKDRSPDWFDAEKAVVELCGIALLIATYFRIRYHFSAQRS
jgi:sulfoxide reductase heme-binding subunit YedZ